MAGECAERQCQPQTNATKQACSRWGDEGENRAEGQGHQDPGLPEKVAGHSTCLAPRHLLVVIVRHVENLCGSHSGRQDQARGSLMFQARKLGSGGRSCSSVEKSIPILTSHIMYRANVSFCIRASVEKSTTILTLLDYI